MFYTLQVLTFTGYSEKYLLSFYLVKIIIQLRAELQSGPESISEETQQLPTKLLL